MNRSAPRTPLQRVLREEGRRQNWLADQVGVTEAHISRVVNGLHCSHDLKVSIARTLRREVADLWPERDELEQAA